MAQIIDKTPGKRIQIDPRDLNPSLGVGLGYPFKNGFSVNYTTQDQIHDNLLNTLLTEPREKLFNPFYGVGLNSLLFEQKVDANFVKEKIQNAIISDELLNSVKITDVKINYNRNDNYVNVIVEWKSKYDGKIDAIEINYKNR